MSVTFVIAPYLPGKWAEIGYSYTEPIDDFAIDTTAYQEQIRLRWPNVELHKPENKNYSMEWILPPSRPGFAGLQGRLSVSRQIVVIGTGPKESFLDFILWYRSFVSSEDDLYLFGSGYEDALHLKPNTTEQDVVDYSGIVD